MIYQGGDLFAIAPAHVLGASVARDNQGVDWLIVVCADGTTDVVYRRPYEKSHSLDGWQYIGGFNSALGDPPGSETQAADIPWFFNGSGTEAQTVRRWWSAGLTGVAMLKRLKLELRDDLTKAVFTIEDRGEQGFVEERSCSTNYDQYGAGGGQYTSSTRGEYTFAVDYKDARPVFLKLRIDGRLDSASTVSVSHAHPPDEHHKDVVTGETNVTTSYRHEYLVWDAGELQTFSDVFAPHTITWTAGATTPTYRHTIDREIREHEITYVFDLRGDQYGYYFYNTIDRDQITDAAEHMIQDTNEGSTLLHGGQAEVLHTNTFPRYESNRSNYGRRYEIRCGGSNFANSYQSYGMGNFGYWSFFGNALGSVASDGQGRQAYSMYLVADLGYQQVGPANGLSNGGSFESLIPGAPPSGAVYYPIEVVQ